MIVGGGLAAARTAEQLRRSEYSGPITIVSDEVHLPYDRPPLSKEVLRKEVDDTALKPRQWYDDNDITLRLGSAARSLDTAAQTLTLEDGTTLGYDELVIATGLVPRRIPTIPDLDGIRVLRTFDESLALREHASAAQRAVIIGAGFIGCEVAASLRSLGVDVVLVEPQPTRWPRCSASRSASWWPGCTAPRASTCASVSGWHRCAATRTSRRWC